MTTTLTALAESGVAAADRADDTAGATLWLTGLPSAGKTTVATALAERLRARGERVQILDGDELRRNLSADLGFDRASRDAHVRRVGYVAELLARNGVVVLVPVIAPYAGARDEVSAHHAAHGTPYLQVHLSTPLDICAERDVKGLYAKAFRGELQGMTGVDDPYEVPVDPDLRLDTSAVDLDTAVRDLLDLLDERWTR
jgi:adenylylsulfate kinase